MKEAAHPWAASFISKCQTHVECSIHLPSVGTSDALFRKLQLVIETLPGKEVSYFQRLS